MTNSTITTLAILLCGSATALILLRAMLDVVVHHYISGDDT
jgi:hypothetical protein